MVEKENEVNMDEFVTMGQAATLLGVSYATVRRLVQRGKLATYKTEIRHNSTLVKRSDLAALRTPTRQQPEPSR